MTILSGGDAWRGLGGDPGEASRKNGGLKETPTGIFWERRAPSHQLRAILTWSDQATFKKSRSPLQSGWSAGRCTAASGFRNLCWFAAGSASDRKASKPAAQVCGLNVSSGS